MKKKVVKKSNGLDTIKPPKKYATGGKVVTGTSVTIGIRGQKTDNDQIS